MMTPTSGCEEPTARMQPLRATVEEQRKLRRTARMPRDKRAPQSGRISTIANYDSPRTYRNPDTDD